MALINKNVNKAAGICICLPPSRGLGLIMSMRKNNFDIESNLAQRLEGDCVKTFSQSMPEKTSSLLQQISKCGGLRDFVLVGGTALAIHLKHRFSEGLDFCCTQGLDLNRKEIDTLLEKLETSGSRIEPVTDDSFEGSGDNIVAHHQTYSIDGLKVDFFVIKPDRLRKWMCSKSFSDVMPGVKIADLKTLMHLKANVLLQRLESRDFYDIKTLIETETASYKEILDSMKSFSDSYLAEEYVLSRLSQKSFNLNDEGVDDLIKHTPNEQIQKDLISFFNNQEKQYKAEVAKEILSHELGSVETLSKSQMDKLGFKGRFWSVPNAKEIRLKKLIANVLCEPRSYRELFTLAGLVGVPALKSWAIQLYEAKEMDDRSYQYFQENISILDDSLDLSPSSSQRTC